MAMLTLAKPWTYPLSIHDACRLGVNVGNWIEDRESVLFQQPSVGGKGGISASTTQRTDFVPEVRQWQPV